MKFLFALFAASVGTAAAEQLTSAELASRWDLDENASVDYASDSNTFTITYTGASTAFDFPQMQEEFYDENCKDDGSGFTEKVIRDYFTTGGMAINADSGLPELSFVIDTAAMAADTAIYTPGDGEGTMKFCVRGGLGYADTDDSAALSIINDPTKTLAEVITAGYVEVNFIESLVTIIYDLTAGFQVLDVNVDPKARVETTEIEDLYELEAWLCVPGSEDVAPNSLSDPFNQGALITVCVAPVEAATLEGILMDGITDFEWTRSDLDVSVTQEAIASGAASDNLLTSYIANTCEGGEAYCQFSSILFADFYISEGTVSGSGNAKLVFATTRRLGEASSRQLQADEGAASPFDLQVPVDITDTGPAGLKTAAGVSFAASTFTMAVALIGAALLA